MLTNNFKNAILTSLSMYYREKRYWSEDTSNVSFSKYLYFMDMNGNQVRLNPGTQHWNDEQDHYGDDRTSVQCLFYGSISPTTDYNTTIQDYGNLEDMIASSSFFYGGGRVNTINHNSWLIPGTAILIVGSGDTPPTKDDYKLDNWIPTTDLKAITYGTSTPLSSLDDFIGTVWSTYYNFSDKNITVKEIGIMTDGFLVTEGNPTPHTKFLFGREILENPIIIKPKEGCTFTFIIK